MKKFLESISNFFDILAPVMTTTMATMTPALRGLRERAKADRRQRILDAVLAILCEGGLPALSTARIGARAGVSVATL